MYNSFVSDMTMLDQMRKEEQEERIMRGCVSETTFDMFDNIFDSVNNAREFLSIYERKANATKDRIGSTAIDLITADTLESYILTLCDSEENKEITKNELVKKLATIAAKYSAEDLDDFDFFDDEESDKKIHRNSMINSETESYVESIFKKTINKERLASWYMQLLRKNPVSMYSSPIYHDERNKELFSPEQLKELEEIKNKLAAIALKTYKNVVNNEFYSSKDARILSEYLIINDDNSPEFANMQGTYAKIVLDNLSLKKLHEKLFVVQYYAKSKCRELNLTMPKIFFPDIMELYETGEHLQDSNIICVNRQGIRLANNLSSFADCILTTAHEVEHYTQSCDKKENKNTYLNYIASLDEFLYMVTGNDNYELNYSYVLTEIDANAKGSEYTVEFLKHLYKDEEEKIASVVSKIEEDNEKTKIKKSSLDFHLDSSDRIMESSAYYIKTMQEEFLRQPELLDNFPIFKKFFNEDGKLKDINTIAKNYFLADESEKRIYSDVAGYYLRNFKKEDFDLDMFDSNESKAGFAMMVVNDLKVKAQAIPTINKEISQMNSSRVSAMELKGHYYDLEDKFKKVAHEEQEFLTNNLDKMTNISLSDGTTLKDKALLELEKTEGISLDKSLPDKTVKF